MRATTHPSSPARRRRRGAWTLVATTVLTGLAIGIPEAATAAPVVKYLGDGRAGEGLVVSFTTGETGTLVITAPDHATLGFVTTSGCDTRYAAQIRCGTDSKVWTSDLMATMRIDPDAPIGTIAGGSIAFEVGGQVVSSTPLSLDVLPPHVAQGVAGETVTVGVPVNGGTSGIVQYTAPDQTTILGVGAEGCSIDTAGTTATCGSETSIWEGTQTLDLAVDANAPFGTLVGGSMAFIQSGRVVSTTPFNLELTPSAPTIDAPEGGILAPDSVVTGTAPADTVVVLELDSETLGEAITTPDGVWAYQPTTPIPDGLHTFSASAMAGGLRSANIDLAINVVTPVAPITPGDPSPEYPGVPDEPAPVELAPIDQSTSLGTPSPRGASGGSLATTGTDTAPFGLALLLLAGGAAVGVVGVVRTRRAGRDETEVLRRSQ